MLVYLATANLFKDYYGLDPGYVQVLSSIIMLPWSFKILYGLISDNLPIYGSRRRSYCVILSTLQLLSAFMMSFYTGTNEVYAAVFLTMMSLSVAGMDVIVDSIMVIQSRKYPVNGSEELQTYSWLCLSFGGICGSLAAAVLTEHYHPNYSFLATALPALVLTVVSIRLTP